MLPNCADEESAVREYAALAVADFAEAPAIDWLAANAAGLKTGEGRAAAFWGFGVSGREGYLPALERAISGGERDPGARAMAVRALGMFGAKAKEEALVAALKDGAWQVKEEAAFALAERRSAAAAEPLIKLLADLAWQPHAAALYALATGAPDKFREALPKAQKDKAYQVRLAACEAAYDAGPGDGFGAAVVALGDEAWPVRAAAVAVLERVWEERCIEPLIDRLVQEKGRLRYDITMTLRAMTGKEIGYSAADWKLWWEANKQTFKIGKRPKTKEGVTAKMGGSEATFYDIPILSDRIGFTIDFSGSMQTEEENKGEGSRDQKGKRKLEIALDEFQKTVKALKPEVRLNLVIMSSEAIVQKVRSFAKKLVPADPRTQALIIGWSRDADKKLSQIQRGRGDTWDAVMDLFADEEVDTIFVLSDGRPSYGACVNDDHFLSEFRRVNRYRRIMVHTVLTGTKGTDKKFMAELAEMTGGRAVAR
ncbi:MAG: HEAT repeat domain-containing protein [Planctomycetes bacterium]|nr:HEAT repeat domain-containing protein [Planctomycetota bacterium]